MTGPAPMTVPLSLTYSPANEPVAQTAVTVTLSSGVLPWG